MQPSAVKDDFIRMVLAKGIYSVDDDGNIWSHHYGRKRPVKQSPMSDGYCRVGLSHEGKVHYVKAHRMVAIAKVPNPQNLSRVNHDNGKKATNEPKNLEWTTPVGNAQHALATGLLKPAKGSALPQSKLTAAKVKAIREERAAGATQAALAQKHGVSRAAIWQLLSGRSWKHV